MNSRRTGLIIALCSVLGIFVMSILFLFAIILVTDDNSSLFESTYSMSSTDSIDLLYIEGTIGEASTSMLSTPTYDHQFIIDSLDALIADESSQALILFIDSPGGSVYHTDEIYLKLLDYKATGRPIYASLGSTAASGGYYLASAADYIVCNRNTLTGSIGVIGASFIDLSEFLSKHGIRVHTVTAGENKGMGNPYEPMTEEQLAIYQAVLDDTHQQFIEIVATGRQMAIEDVRSLADGRIYTARQALELGLVDELGTLEDTIALIREDYDLYNAELYTLAAPEPSSLDSLLMKLQALSPPSELEVALSLQELLSQCGYYYSGALRY
ncbi:MAG: signal peptide peptidase SppA [Cellulosilyticaceae bacterium]